MVFDFKYDLRHKARVVAGSDWTINDKKNIYSGFENCVDFHVVHVTSEMLSCMEKQKRNPN
jgi:hypothetical protein